MERIRDLLARVQGVHGPRADAWMAAVLSVASVIWLIPQWGDTERPALAAVLMAVPTAAVAWRRRAPLEAACAGILAVIGFETLAYVDNWIFPALALVLNLYSVAAYEVGRRATLALPLTWALLMIGVAVDRSSEIPGDLIFATFVFWLLPISAGRTMRNRRALTIELQAKARRLEREREERAREAVTTERARIARELHDVIAHSVSVMVIQAGAARRVAGTDREQAREALQAAQAAGREALLEMRRMVGVLRRGDEELEGAAPPGLEQVESLAARARAAGLPVELRVEGEREPLSPGADLAAYRVVQEALTNAIKHAGRARARVLVRYGGDAVDIEVSDTGRGPSSDGSPAGAEGGGHGLVGMRERVALYGGHVEAGRRRGGGFAVRAHIPMDAVPA